MKPGDVVQRLTSGNLWWRDPGWADRDVQLRAAAAAGYAYEPGVLSSVPRGGLVLLRGPRRVGKSVELKRFVQQVLDSGAPPRAVIHAAVDGWRASDLRSLVEVGKRLAPPGTSHRWWLVDEICGVSGWAPEIKNLRDNDPEFATDTVVLTGSNARDLTQATSALAGRRGEVARPDRTLLPMGFRTFVTLMLASGGQAPPDTPRLAGADLRSPHAAQVFHELVAWESELTAWWEIYLQVGGFPQAVSAQLGDGDLAPVVQALFDVVQRDIFGSTQMSEPQVAALLARIASNIASPMNTSTVAADVAVSQDTGARRLADLVTSYVLWTCPAGADQRPVLRSQVKRYFTDPLFARLAHMRNPAVPSPDVTRLTEQQLGMALLRAAETATPGIYPGFDQVLYERTKTRKEIDFVGPLLDPVAIEAKYTDTGKWKGEAVTVDASCYAGVLATRGVLDTSASSPDDAWAVPASLLAFSIDV
ncbi:MAG: AAA family ATPase [Micrococcales bacterium]|nr:AAA family ATPase [Micrococcales bacterium]